MLDKKVFEENLQKLISVFPTWEIKQEDPNCIKVWYSFFQDMNDSKFIEMVNEYIKKEIKSPTVAGLLNCKEWWREL